jgi:hypothetical protein
MPGELGDTSAAFPGADERRARTEISTEDPGPSSASSMSTGPYGDMRDERRAIEDGQVAGSEFESPGAHKSGSTIALI